MEAMITARRPKPEEELSQLRDQIPDILDKLDLIRQFAWESAENARGLGGVSVVMDEVMDFVSNMDGCLRKLHKEGQTN